MDSNHLTRESEGKSVTKPKRPVQLNLFGEPFTVPPTKTPVKRTGTFTYYFEGDPSAPVSGKWIDGVACLIAGDLCGLLGIINATQAVERLDDDEKVLSSTYTPGGLQQAWFVNEFGWNQLILNSRKPAAKRLKRWLTHEVMPALTKTGTYTMPRADDRVARTARRLKSDPHTAKVRCENADENKALAAQLKASGAARSDYQAVHRAVYLGQFGVDIDQLKRAGGLTKPRDTPLDHMSAYTLAENRLIKERAARQIRDAGDLPAVAHAAYYEAAGKSIAAAEIAALGPGYCYGFEEQGKRGLVLDIIRPQLEGDVV